MDLTTGTSVEDIIQHPEGTKHKAIDGPDLETVVPHCYYEGTHILGTGKNSGNKVEDATNMKCTVPFIGALQGTTNQTPD